jgi:hypothetical protein
MLPSPSLVHLKQKTKTRGNGNVVVIAFPHVLQSKNKQRRQRQLSLLSLVHKKKTMAVLLSLPSLVCRKQKTKKGA